MKQFSVTDIKVNSLSIDGHIDKLKLTAIEQTKSDTAVDVFVYDTSLDSDAGAWRKRTSHTSWYNETLNTSTRGSRREFPAVAVIVTENDKVTIYDGDDPDLPMWMVFQSGGTFDSGSAQLIGNSTTLQVSSLMLNGILTTCNSNSYHALLTINFLSETSQAFRNNGNYIIPHNIAERHVGDLGVPSFSGNAIVNNAVNDVAMTVLPGAPIDADTGLPVPTIAVATDDGVSVIRDDGSVINITCSQQFFGYSYFVVFDQLNRLFFSLDGQGNKRRIWGLNNIPAGDLVVTTDINEKQNGDIFIADNNGYGTATKDMFLFNQSDSQVEGFTSDNSIGTSQGLFKAFIDKQDSSKSLYNYITSDYNTGWMPGDIKLAALCDTTVEEAVGVDESTELLVDGTGNWIGDFDVAADLDNWELGGDTAGISVVDNKLRVVRSTTLTYATIAVNVIEGKRYVVSGTTSGSSGSGYSLIRVSTSNKLDGSYIVNDMIGDGDHFKSFTATYTGVVYVGVGYANEPGQADFDNISVKQTGELITNGTFYDGTTGWVSTNNATLSNTDDNLRIDKTDTTYFGAKQEFATVTGKRYKVCYELIESDSVNGTNGAYFQISGINVPGSTHQPYNTDVSDLYPSSTGSYSYEFVALSDTSEVRAAMGSTGTYAVWDNISVRLAVEDRSVNNNGLQVFGEITKTAVAPGAELQSFLGFSENNYFMQPYNDDLDFGTGDFCVMGWLKKSSSLDYQVIASYGNGDILSDQGWVLRYGPDEIQFRSDAPGGGHVTSSRGEVLSSWLHVCCVRSNNILSIYENGSIVASQSDYTADLGAGNDSTFVLGTNRTNDSLNITKGDFIGSLALWRISKTAPTAEQIKKIYRDEEQLFQPGAKCTLDGTSDAVTALAHDSVTDLLHVGTSSGTSVFSGLRRVTSDTEPVTTCIDAQDELVVKR